MRIFNFFAALLVLVIMSPVLIALCLSNLIFLGRPIFFRQYRLGKRGLPFSILKFRSMRVSDIKEKLYETDSERLTPYGAWLRKYSLDELPSFWNVLVGDMALVGPRPLLLEFWQTYTSQQKRRHDVLPGLTGLAQIRGRNSITWPVKFRYDVWYVDHRSFLLDLFILWKTLPYTFSGEDTQPPIDGYIPVSHERGA